MSQWHWANIRVSRFDLDQLSEAAYAVQGLTRVLNGIGDADGTPDTELGEWVNGFTIGSLHSAINQLGRLIGEDVNKIRLRAEKAAEKEGDL